MANALKTRVNKINVIVATAKEGGTCMVLQVYTRSHLYRQISLSLYKPLRVTTHNST